MRLSTILNFTAAFTLIALLATGSLAWAAETSVQMVNPGFEDGIEGWSTWYARQPTKVSTVDGPTGQCLQAFGESGSRVVISQAFEAQPQARYTLRYRFNAAPNGPSGGAMGYCRISFADPNGKFIDYPNTKPLLDTFGQWVEAEQTFKTPLSIGEVTIGFNQSGAADLRIDEVSVERVSPPSPAPNTWDELTQKRDEPLVFSSWQYTNSAEHFRQMGLKYGWEYRLQAQYEELKESRTVPFWRGESTWEAFSKHGIEGCPYLYFSAKDYREAHYGGEPPEDIPYILDPVWHDGYVAGCREMCRKYGEDPGIEYFFVQDESYGRFKSAIMPADERVSDLWTQLNKEVRDAYGGGVYGLPEGPDDENAHRWIAYWKWVQDRWARTFRKLSEVIDETGCDAKLLGPDEVGILMPLPWHELAESVDVFTGQCLYSRGSARTYVPGFTTKYSRDLTGKPVHNATQIVSYSGSPPPEEVQRQYSQVLRNGGEGEMLIGVEWFDRELNHHQYSAPARWATVKNLLRYMSDYEVQTPDSSSVALLYSSVSGMAQRRAFNSDRMLAAYAICGPKLKGWPTIVDSHALDEGAASLQDYRVVIMPRAPYETQQVVDQLRSFVDRGGLLICADPNALQTDDMGKVLRAESFLGATTESIGPQRQMAFDWPGTGAENLRVYGSAFALNPTKADTQVIARYGDGTAAATLTPFGEGQVLMFGTNPFASGYVSEDSRWVQWWRAVLRKHGMKTELPIWDLRLPDAALVQAQAPEGVCLTGNNFVRCQNGVYLGANDPVDGTYTLSVPPDLSAESAGDGAIPFTEGDLTDRVEATRGPFDNRGMAEEPYREADWANRWSSDRLEDGLEIHFSLPAPRELSRVRLWYSGGFETMTIIAIDGETRTEVASTPGEDVGPDVVDLTVPLNGTWSQLKLQIDGMDTELAIADIELWGTEAVETGPAE